MTQGLLECSISFYQIGDLAAQIYRGYGRRLPSASQLHGFKKKVLSSSPCQIKKFLVGRIEKKKWRSKWIFEIGDGETEKIPFYRWIITTFVDPVSHAQDPSQLASKYRPGIRIDLPRQTIVEKFEELKPLIIKKALCEFIDLLLLYQKGLCFNEKSDDKGTTLIEVLVHG